MYALLHLSRCVCKLRLSQQFYDHFSEAGIGHVDGFYTRQNVIDDKVYILEIQEMSPFTGAVFTSSVVLQDSQLRAGHGFILVYSITSRPSFNSCKILHQRISRLKESRNSDIPIMLVGNKIDQTEQSEVSIQEGQDLARELGCMFVQASAKDSTNVEKAFYDLVRDIRE